jgi:hypothetical protein
MTLCSWGHTAFTRLIHDLNKQSSLKGPFTLGSAKKSPSDPSPDCALIPFDVQKHILGKNGFLEGPMWHEWFSLMPGKLDKSNLFF